MRESLGQNQISPQARPVGAFVQPGRMDVAAPGQPQMMPDLPGMRLLPQGSGGSVAGTNQLADLAAALAPFGKGAIALGGLGAEIFASQEYQRGQAEVARAQVLVNQQMMASRARYAADGRRLEKTDPIGAVMMDRVNPWREAGRQNRLSRTAGQEIVPEVMRLYRSAPGLAELPEGAPEIMQLHAQAVQSIAQKYRLDETSPGFIEYVLPQIGQAQQELYKQHNEDRVKIAKERSWREAAAAGFAIYQRAMETGQIEFEVFSPDGRSSRQLAIKARDPAAWALGVQVSIGQEINRLIDETGIGGEASALRREAIVRLAQMSRDAGSTELQRILLQVDVAPPRKGGERVTAGDAYGVEILKGGEEVDSIRYQQAQRAWQAQQRASEQLIQNFESSLASRLDGINEGPARGEITRQAIQEFQARGAPLNELLRSAKSINRDVTDLANFSYDTSGMDSLLQSFQEQEGVSWDAIRNGSQFESLLSTVPPEERGKYRERWSSIRRQKEREQADLPLALVNPILAAKMKANLKLYYPGDVTEAALRGSDVSAMMAWGDADVARSAQLQHSAYLKHISARLAEAAAKKGAKLENGEILRVTSQAVEEYGSKNKEALNDLFPGSDRTDTPSVSGRPRPPRPGGGDSKPRPQVYPSFQLDNMPGRQERLRSGEAVLARPSVEEEIGRILNGRQPSAAVQRAARDAGLPVGQFLLRQLRFYPGGEQALPAEGRQQLLRSTRDAQGAANALRASATADRPVARRNSWYLDSLLGGLDALTGGRPAAAAVPPWGKSLIPRAGGAPAVAAMNRQAPPVSGPVLSKLATGRLVRTDPGLCVTAVLESMAANKIPNPDGTDGDAGNNPRGLASQLVNKFGWRPLPGLGSPRRLSNVYGTFSANVMSAAEYSAAVRDGRIPSGALVFQTMRDWGGSFPRSRGFDVAIARNGGRSLWNGSMQGTLIYGAGTRQVFVLVPGQAGSNTARRN